MLDRIVYPLAIAFVGTLAAMFVGKRFLGA